LSPYDSRQPFFRFQIRKPLIIKLNKLT